MFYRVRVLPGLPLQSATPGVHFETKWVGLSESSSRLNFLILLPHNTLLSAH
jgi:hypothetical protein